MRSLVFEGKTWDAYEALRQKDKKQHVFRLSCVRQLILIWSMQCDFI